jgi:hypothetical protein
MADNSPTSAIDISNLALSELKVSPISSLDQEGSVEAQLCKRHYDVERKALLRTHIWNFAKTEEALARATDGLSSSYDDVYVLTNTYVRLISIGDVLVGEKKTEFDIRSVLIGGSFKRCILIDNDGSATLSILYIRNVTTVTEFDPLFVKLLKFELAMAIAPSITLKPSTRASIKDGLADARLQARGIDGQERPPVRINNSKFLSARKSQFVEQPLNTTF